MTERVVIDAMDWHRICHELNFDDSNRKGEFEECFNCKVTWRSNLQDDYVRRDPVMLLDFYNKYDAVMFALKWATK